jgi:amino acid adenylation domain-containing protein
MEESETGLSVFAEYNSDLFDEATIDELLSSFQVLLEGIVADPGVTVGTLPVLTPAQRQRLLVDWNATRTRYPRDKTIPELFARQVIRNPDSVAVISEAGQFTYRQIDQRANQVANLLRKLGVGPDVLVAVCLERSQELIVALLGILKAGGAYVSLDPSCTRERLAYMLEDARAGVLLTQQKLQAVFAGDELASPLKVICLDKDWATIAHESTGQPDFDARRPAPTDLAYVSYTSGSTGKPKGVCVPQRAVIRLLFNTDYVLLNSADTVAQIASCAFDASTFEIWGALLHGGRLAILSQQVVLSARALAREIRSHRITTMFVTTGLFNQLSREVPDIFAPVRHVLFGGEAANPACVRNILKNSPGSRLLHMYGPTEATTFASWHEVRELEADAASVPIGRPLANTEVYVLDELRQPVPIGVVGELYIGGDGLARGYLNQPALTAEKFVSHPFNSEADARLYKTGDRVRYRSDGNLEFIGRADGQVKLRGFRVELGEIEVALNQHLDVQECTATAFEDSSKDKRLVAYVVARRAGLTADDLRAFLRTKLPDYMVPSAFVFLPALPLNANGKVNRRALPAPDQVRPEQTKFVQPRDETESRLVGIWEDLLTIRPVSVVDNFFDLGGHSLLVIRLLARIERAFGRSLPISAVFQSPTIEHLAELIRQGKVERSGEGSSIVEIQPKGSKPPLFLVHGAGGGMLWGYTNLARYLGLDQPVYGFKPRDETEGEASCSIETMAAQLLSALCAFQPNGPYYLGGYCFGGNVAYEMARQLQNQGHKIALLALMNSTPTDPSPRVGVPKSKQVVHLCANVCGRVGSFLRRPHAEQRRFIAWQVRSLKRRIIRRFRPPTQVSAFDAEDLVDLSIYSPEQRRLWEAHIRALVEHHTQPYTGPVTLFRSRGHHFGCPQDFAYGWSEFAPDTAVHIVPGAHEQILEEPHVKVLAEELAKCLRKAHSNVTRATWTADRPEEISNHQLLTGSSFDEGGRTREATNGHFPSPLLATQNDTYTDYPRDKCVHQLFEEQAERTPEAIALIFENKKLTYRQLNQSADQLSRRLQALNVGPDVPVGLCLDRSPEMVVGVLAILKAGGAYVPLDPTYPRERLQLMLENARAPVFLTRQSLSSIFKLPIANCQLVYVDDSSRASLFPHHLTPIRSRPTDLAYVIHTSGSTGTPKGVAMPHRPLVNLIAWQLGKSKLPAGAKTLQFSSLSFDVSFQEMFSTWCAGGTLVLIGDELRRDPFALLRFITEQKIERLFLPFVGLQQLAEAYREKESAPSCLREVITAGEQLQITPAIARLFERLPDCTLHNQYGPTESHVVTEFTLSGPPDGWPGLPPIGRPIANTQIHLLDLEHRPVAVGEEGELHIGGDCLARGYLHRPDLTAERFIPNPFSTEPGARLYKTGDRARWMPDGNVEFLGRLDHQVKIRGYRIELNEVEVALGQHPSVRECAAAVREDKPGERSLVAYVVGRKGADASERELRLFLQQRLPDYMLPSAFVFLDKLPLTPTGKVNRRALPAPKSLRCCDDPGLTPRTPIEKSLAEIWCSVLGLERVGIQHNFFDVGGHSLLAVQIVKRIEVTFKKQLSVATIFQSPTIEKLAGLLQQGGEQPSSRTSIVEIQMEGTKAPLFLVHGAGGGMFWGYANLSRHLGAEQPLYGFNSRGLEGLQEFGTIEEMAAHYVADLRAFQRSGPYRLGGYCFGGNVAYEMARQLVAQGEKIALLALFNSWPPNSSYTRVHLTPKLCIQFLKNLGSWTGYVLQLKPTQQRDLILWKTRAIGRKWLRFTHGLRKAAPDIDVAEWVDLSAQPEDRHELWAAHIRAYLKHCPKPFAGRLTLFRTRYHPLLCSFDDACGWRELAEGGVTVHVVPGAHESILDEPHVRVVAESLGGCLRDIDQA